MAHARQAKAYICAVWLVQIRAMSRWMLQQCYPLCAKILLVSLLPTLPAWTPRASHRAQKSHKLFFNDSGLMAHLLGLGMQLLQNAPGLPGPLLETFMRAELQKQCAWASTACELMHYRTSTGMEVDFIAQDRQGRVVGIEVKYGLRRLRAAHHKDLQKLSRKPGQLVFKPARMPHSRCIGAT
jgi:predicted AAA+ superfamily ATPase